MTRKEYFKVSVFVPPDYLNTMIDALCQVTVNKMGNYSNSMSWWPVTSTWTSLTGAKPFIGKAGKRTITDEYKLEFLCDVEDIERAVDCIDHVHPYEQPVIDLIPVFLPDDFLKPEDE